MFRTILTVLLSITAVACAAVPDGPGVQPRVFRGDHPVQPQSDGLIVAEAEEFDVQSPMESGGWQALPWGANYYAATFANTFLSRKAFLGAPADGPETVAAIQVTVTEAGKYLVLARYEAAYRFETQFRVVVEQAGQTRLDRLYGARDNVKIWAFSQKLQKEVAWPWGAVENVVWEGHDAFAELQPGVATIKLIAGPQPAPQAKRNVDLILLTRDQEMVNKRIATEQYLPLDGLLTQADDVWVKVHNPGVEAVSFNAQQVQEHSPYWIHQRNWKPIAVDVEPGQTTDWLDAGNLWDSLSDAQWVVNSTGPCKVEVGVRSADGIIQSLRTIDLQDKATLIAPADMRYAREVRLQQEGIDDLLAQLDKTPKHGKAPSETLIIAYSAIPEFEKLYGLARVQGDQKVYVDWRGQTAAQLEETCQKLTAQEREAIRVVSLGDEIGLPSPDAATATEGFVAYLKAQGVKPSDLNAAAGDDWGQIAYNLDQALEVSSPGVYYWSRRYLHHYGIHEQKKLTDVLRKQLPNAHIGANYSPHHGGSLHSYLPPIYQWVSCFREDGMTLPWSEDYIWQLPVGSPQMNGINLDMFRAANRGKEGRKILYYVMPHWPGNTPAMWRRLYHNALGHGMTITNLFEFHPVWMAYTENHVSSPEMFATVLTTFRELGLYEDIVQSGAVRPAQVGLWFSETADIWGDNKGSFAAAKRALYTAILHQQVPLDFLVEQDAADGTLDQYRVIYLTDSHVTRAASTKLAEWVKAGGVLMATAGAGMFDEYNAPNQTMRELLGVNQTSLDAPAEAQLGFIKQDIQFVKPLATVSWGDQSLQALGVVSRVDLPADGGTQLSATFADGSPAVTSRQVEKGRAIYCAFLPSLSYYQPAIPLRPVDRGSTDDAMAHFLPTDFSPGAADLIKLPLTDAGVVGPVQSSVALVECSIIDSPKGTAIVVTNWTTEPLKGLTLTLDFPVATGNVSLGSGGKIKVEQNAGKTQLKFDLDLGDVVIFRQ